MKKLFLLLIILAAGCGIDQIKLPPGLVLRDIQCSQKVPVFGETVSLTPQIENVENRELSYLWVCSAGELLNSKEAVVLWVAPLVSGEVNITLFLTDINGGRRLSRTIHLQPEAPPLLDQGYSGREIIFEEHFDSVESLDRWTKAGSVEWNEIGNDDGYLADKYELSKQRYGLPEHCVRLRNGGKINEIINIAGYRDVQISFFCAAWTLEAGEEGQVLLQLGTGTNTTIKRISQDDNTESHYDDPVDIDTDNSNYAALAPFVHSLEDTTTAEITLTFSCTGSGPIDFFFIDDVVISGVLDIPSLEPGMSTLIPSNQELSQSLGQTPYTRCFFNTGTQIPGRFYFKVAYDSTVIDVNEADLYNRITLMEGFEASQFTRLFPGLLVISGRNASAPGARGILPLFRIDWTIVGTGQSAVKLESTFMEDKNSLPINEIFSLDGRILIQ